MSGPDYILDISSMTPAPHETERRGVEPGAGGNEAGEATAAQGTLRGRPWLAIHWRCCSVYSRIYRDAAGAAYIGRCPRCARPLHIAVGEGGTDSRFFEAS